MQSGATRRAGLREKAIRKAGVEGHARGVAEASLRHEDNLREEIDRHREIEERLRGELKIMRTRLSSANKELRNTVRETEARALAERHKPKTPTADDEKDLGLAAALLAEAQLQR